MATNEVLFDPAPVHAAVAAVAPIHGLVVGDPADKTTWRVDFDDSATAAQKTAAQAVIEAWVDPGPPPPVLSDRQFYMQLVIAGYIAQADARTLMTGNIPAVLQAVIDKLPAAAQFPAEMALLGTSFEIDSPFIAAAAPALDPALADRTKLVAFWQAAGKL